jgi:hypothetical protein
MRARRKPPKTRRGPHDPRNGPPMPYSNGNSFTTGQPAGIRDIREPWYVRMLRPVQDRGSA